MKERERERERERIKNKIECVKDAPVYWARFLYIFSVPLPLSLSLLWCVSFSIERLHVCSLSPSLPFNTVFCDYLFKSMKRKLLNFKKKRRQTSKVNLAFLRRKKREKKGEKKKKEIEKKGKRETRVGESESSRRERKGNKSLDCKKSVSSFLPPLYFLVAACW